MQKKKRVYTLLVVTASAEDAGEVSNALCDENFHLIFHEKQTSFLSRNGKAPDLILLSSDIPAEEGYCNIRYFRRRFLTRQTPVIFLSSIHNETVISECLSYPSTDFITLPLKGKELLFRIYHQLSLVKARQTIKRQNERLKETIASRDKLYSVIAHDLRAPIGTIKMINAIIESEKNKIRNAGIRKKFEMINETTEEAYNLLENLLRWTRNQTGRTRLVTGQFDIASTIRQVVTLFTTIASSKNIHLILPHYNTLMVCADEDMIKTILRNLISNAIKFTFPGGKVEITLTTENNDAFISVKDNGIGIPEEDRKKILKGKESVTTYGTRNEKGCGLGLLLCRDFIRMNKGKFYLSSHPGQGSTFSFTVPLALPDSEIV